MAAIGYDPLLYQIISDELALVKLPSSRYRSARGL